MVSTRLNNYPIIEGITGGIVYDIVNQDIMDKVITVNDEEAIAMTERLIREEGLFCGISAGANVVAAMAIGRETPNCRKIVTVLPDSYNRYLTTEHYVT